MDYNDSQADLRNLRFTLASRTIGTYDVRWQHHRDGLLQAYAFGRHTLILITIRTIGILSERVDTEDLIGTVYVIPVARSCPWY